MSVSAILRGMPLCIVIYILALVFATIRMSYAHDYTSWLAACKPYRAQVERILDEEQASRNYFYLMVAESRCSPRAVSRRGAIGFWQLMPKTSRDYGCINPHDLTCATRAAARYLKHLEETFTQFDDIIAAYNMGGHNYRRHGKTRQASGLIYTVRMLMGADHDHF